MQLFKVYPLADERVKEIAQQSICTGVVDELRFLYTHYSIEHNFFCNEGVEEYDITDNNIIVINTNESV